MFARMKNAILSLKNKVVTWPTKVETERTKVLIKTQDGFHQHRPVKYGDSYALKMYKQYVTRSVKSYIIMEAGQARYMIIGHRETVGYTRINQRFYACEYLVGDCAYSARYVMVQTFKKLPRRMFQCKTWLITNSV